jgi:cytochrome c553
MARDLATSWRFAFRAFVAMIAVVSGSPTSRADDFEASLARVDEALRKNPKHVPAQALDSCLNRRYHAVRLYQSGQAERAKRSLDFCFDVLAISPTAPALMEKARPERESMEQIQARAAREVEAALHLDPNVAKGLEIYRTCALCHTPEGWGLSNGSVPQIAGQHRTVVIKQLADIRAGNRENFLMLPYSSVESIGGTQAVADVAGYIDTLEISVDNGKGPGSDLPLGEALYRDNCARCHGAAGEGDAKAFIPRIQAQHYNYLVSQFEQIRDGKRRNANPEMAGQIQGFDERQSHAVLDWVSRLQPPAELQAPPGWRNPDFAK